MAELTSDEIQEKLRGLIRSVPDFPKPGIMFRDITTLLENPEGFQLCVDLLLQRYDPSCLDVVVGIESRGFVFAAPLALALKKPFVMMRKPKKLPGKTIGVDFKLEYASDRLEMHEGSIAPGSRVLIIDDLLATGGTLGAACKLTEMAGGTVHECACVAELPELKGKERLGRPVHTLVEFYQ